MTTDEGVLARVAGYLDALAIPYMITGSFASSVHGRPRSTHDADVVIDPTPEGLERLVAELASGGFYVDADTARDALRRRRQFNAIDTTDAFKIDLIIRKDRPFSRAELDRRQPAQLSEGGVVSLASPEDTILSKLEWSKTAGGSERQVEDARSVVEVKGEALDREYIERWARELGVLDLWHRIASQDPKDLR